MNRAYLFARRVGTSGTVILETTRKEAVEIMRENRKKGYQLGILCGVSYDSVKRVYGEYAPFRKVESVSELLNSVEDDKYIQ
ncbi:hypothetical protein [Crassaminicella profunda]|uniref:hypothetical protein n=1 Tax=Crassaminicella profunda TaxID=1286698 RepID=UPI001CA71904|nr:hypothetical protein [Crassaminicella profunda]QZY55566.1 hypothetical protein K7H06_00520 [Crassaminicella profunda]